MTICIAVLVNQAFGFTRAAICTTALVNQNALSYEGGYTNSHTSFMGYILVLNYITNGVVV